MSASLNRCTFIGNLTRDPQFKTVKNHSICDFAIAMNRSWTTESGEKKEAVTFVDLTAFGRQAEAISKHLHKGDPIYVEARVKNESWTDKETNEKRSKIGFDVERFQFIGGKRDAVESPE